MTIDSTSAEPGDGEAVPRGRRHARYLAGALAAVLVLGAFVLYQVYSPSCDGDTRDTAANICYDMPDAWEHKPALSSAEAVVIGTVDTGRVLGYATSYARLGLPEGTGERLADEAQSELGAYLSGVASTTASTSTVDGHRAATATATTSGEGIGRAFGGAPAAFADTPAYLRATMVEIEPGRYALLVSVVKDDPNGRGLADRLHKSVDVYE